MGYISLQNVVLLLKWKIGLLDSLSPQWKVVDRQQLIVVCVRQAPTDDVASYCQRIFAFFSLPHSAEICDKTMIKMWA